MPEKEPIESISFRINGQDALQGALDLLSRFEGDTKYTYAHIELATSATQSDNEIGHSAPSSDQERQSEENEQTTRSIQSGTSHHKVLSALQRLSEQQPVTTKRVLGLVDLPKGTVYAAMSELVERGLVVRSNTKNEDNSYEYQVSHAGEEEIERLGVID